MKAIVKPSKLAGRIHAAASKSSMQRACAAALLTRGSSTIYNPGKSNDDLAAMDIIKNLGAIVEKYEDKIVIESKGIAPINDTIDCGESGLSIRMFTPIAALHQSPIEISGHGSLMKRPMDFFDNILPQLDVKVSSNNGMLPIAVHGPLVPKNIEIDGSLSSQFLTGLLFAYAYAPIHEAVTIHVKDLKSQPYIDLTLDVMKQFGMNLPENHQYEKFIFNKSVAASQPAAVVYDVEGDWSGGAFLLVSGAISGPIKVSGLNLMSAQADKAIYDAMLQANVAIAFDGKGFDVFPGNLTAFEFDATHCPDLFPPLVALAAYCNGVTTIRGVSRLEHKESNRGITLKEEFAKMGIEILLEGDMMKVYGGSGVRGNIVHSRSDHRIAMACAVAALGAEGITEIEEAQAINKSYPDFFSHLQYLNAEVQYGLSDMMFKNFPAN